MAELTDNLEPEIDLDALQAEAEQPTEQPAQPVDPRQAALDLLERDPLLQAYAQQKFAGQAAGRVVVEPDKVEVLNKELADVSTQLQQALQSNDPNAYSLQQELYNRQQKLGREITIEESRRAASEVARQQTASLTASMEASRLIEMFKQQDGDRYKLYGQRFEQAIQEELRNNPTAFLNQQAVYNAAAMTRNAIVGELTLRGSGGKTKPSPRTGFGSIGAGDAAAPKGASNVTLDPRTLAIYPELKNATPEELDKIGAYSGAWTEF